MIKMPLGMQAHHALMDGIHMAEYYRQIQEYLSHPADILGHSWQIPSGAFDYTGLHYAHVFFYDKEHPENITGKAVRHCELIKD